MKKEEENIRRSEELQREYDLLKTLYVESLQKEEELKIKLQESQKKYTTLYDSTPLSFHSLNEDGCLINVNLMWLKTLGYEKNEVIGKWFGSFLHPENVEAFKAGFPEYKRIGYVSDLEFKLRKKDDYYINVSFQGHVEYTPEGKFKQTYCIFKDITEQKKAEYALKESEEKFRLMILNSPDITVIHDKGGIVRFVSPQLGEITGYNPESAIGKPVPLHLIYPEDLPKVTEASLLLKEGKDVIDLEYRLYTASGGIIWLQHTARPIFVDNTIVGFQNNMRDISKRKEYENELSRKEAFIRAVMDNLPIGIAVNSIVPGVNFEYMNDNFAQIYGVKKEDLISSDSFWDVVYEDEDFRKEIKKRVLEDWASGDINRLYWHDIPLTRKGEKKRYITARNTPIPDKNLMISSVWDVTERKLIEEELTAAKEKAEESSRLKTAFLQNMSHEIRSPMNAIMGFSELLVRHFNDKEKLEKFTTIIRQRCRDLLDIINDILDIAKIESGQLSVNLEECDLNSLFSELSAYFAEHQIRLGYQDVELNLHSQCVQTIILTDKVKLKQIFINLLSNAFKFTNRGNITGGCKPGDNNEIIFFVSDTGVGIPKDKQEAVFERFVQLNQNSEKSRSGTGLGLSIVKGLIKLMDGEIFLESEPGKGSTFTFKIPAKALTHTEAEKNVPFNEREDEYDFSGKTVLVVEDEEFNAEFLRELLAPTGMIILHALTGKEAIDLSITHHLDIILMDIRLPDIDGYEIVRRIRERDLNIKIIAQTAYASSDDCQKALDAGCNDYISKPIKNEELLTMISKHLS